MWISTSILYGYLDLLRFVSSNGWKIEDAKSIVSENRTRNLLSLDLHEKMGVVTTQLKDETIHLLEDTTHDPTSDYWKSYYAKRYAHVFNHLGRSKNHKVYTHFKAPLIPSQVKGQKVLIHIQDRVAGEIKNLEKDGHIEKLDKCTTDHFIAPVDNQERWLDQINAKPMNDQI